MINFQLFKKLYQRFPIRDFFRKVEIVLGVIVFIFGMTSIPLIVWKFGSDNKIIDIYCEEMGCVYDVVGKIWVLEGKYYDTKKECKKRCIFEAKNSQDTYSREYYEEYIPMLIKQTTEYKSTWYYKTENIFGE